MQRLPSLAISLLVLCAGTSASFGQDSVASTPGGNDALSAYDASSQRVRYVVDLTSVNSSWNSGLLVAPIAKATRDLNPTFRTQILGSLAVSNELALGTTFSGRTFGVWNTPGAGVHPTSNTAPGQTGSIAGFRSQFGVALSDFSLSPSNATSLVIGRDSTTFTRLYVERVAAASSRSTAAALETSTVALGGVDAFGNLTLRVDNFNTAPTTTSRVLGENIPRISFASRNGSVNTFFASGASNTAADTGATTYVISNEGTPTNTPTIVNQSGVGEFALAYDFSGRFRTGSSTANLASTITHLPSGTTGHRGNPTWANLPFAGSTGGMMAAIGVTSAFLPNRLIAYGLNFGTGGTPPTVTAGSPRLLTLPAPITAGSFSANATNAASFRQYLSQTGFRGGNGQVAIGANAAGLPMLAATATDPTAGNFIAVVTIPSPTQQQWTVAAFPGQAVLNGQNGTAIGNLSSTNLNLSAPGMDRLGNVYFVASWQPNLQPAATGVFKAVNTGSGYQLELLLTTGQTIAGANSGRSYAISQLTLVDQDSIASGTLFSGSILQQTDPLASDTNPTSIRSFGGVVFSAVITYDNAGTPEAYDAVLFVGPATVPPPPICAADFDGNTLLQVSDIFSFLQAWFAGCLAPNPPTCPASADFNNNSALDVADIFAFLAAWFAGCP